MSNFNQRIFGCAIIRAINANYNADFSHQPRTLPNGVCYATDKALKYLIRNYLKANYEDQEKIFYFKSFSSQMKPLSLNGRYLSLFKEFPKNSASQGEKKDEFYVFLKEENQIHGIIGSKIPKKKIDEFFKELPDDSELKDLKGNYTKLCGKLNSIKLSSIQSSLKEEEEDFYFFFENNSIKKIPKDEASESIIKGIELKLSGGINKPKLTKNLLSCIDIRLFGATFAGETNVSIHGPVQINHGVNIWKENIIFSEQIMSPFADKEGADASTLGRQSKLQEGHYLHHFSVNPKNIDEIVRLAEEGAQNLSAEDITKLKEALRKGATYFDSAAKAGIDNEMLIWVTLKDGSKAVLPTFNNLVKLDKEGDKTAVNLEGLKVALARLGDEVASVELHYLIESVLVNNAPDMAAHFDISSGKQITKS